MKYMTVQHGMQGSRWAVQVSLYVLTAVPCALLNPTHPSSSPSSFHHPFSRSINAAVFFLDPSSSVHWRCPPLSASSLLSSPPSLRLSVCQSDPNGQMSLFQTASLSLDSGLSCFWRARDSEILKCMRSHMLVGERETDRFLSRNKSLHHPQTEDTLRPCLWARTASGNHWPAAVNNSDLRHFVAATQSMTHNALLLATR